MTPYRPLLIATLAAASLVGTAARANDFPTVARVLWVQDCLREHPGPNFEMINKCACAADRVADQLSFEQYDELSTAAKASTIGGERGSYLRDNEGIQDEVRRYRKLQAEAKKACFVIR